MSNPDHPVATQSSDKPERWQLRISGIVQGVGFRPFVYRLARELKLSGWIQNDPRGVVIEVQAPLARLHEFTHRLRHEAPVHSRMDRFEQTTLSPSPDYSEFEIHASSAAGLIQAGILPDLATCPECAVEVQDPTQRRYRYPFTNCTYCGPRFSIIESLPYDRSRTTMKGFRLCLECRAEYEDPNNRRFHAQPIACPACGPQLELRDARGAVLAQHDDALMQAAHWLQTGAIVAVKGLGGFHLMCVAESVGAVGRLRTRKQREAKPLALMFPSLDAVLRVCTVSELEKQLLQSSAAPIVLLARSQAQNISPNEVPGIAPNVAPDNPYLGVMLPYTPLHRLLLQELNRAVVATSGNLSEEPICIDNHEAGRRLAGIADYFLGHNRPIVRAMEDSVVRVLGGRLSMLRRARGYAPAPVVLAEPVPPLLAVGGHLKNTVAIARNRQVYISSHIGDLETAEAMSAFEHAVEDLQRIYEIQPVAIACDAHPDYLSTQYARQQNRPLIPVQHHQAHCWSVTAEHGLHPPLLGVSWDGTGFGLDGTIWGGEFFYWEPEGDWTRLAHWKTFPLPGGEKAIRYPARQALGLLYAWLGESVFNDLELSNQHPLRAWWSYLSRAERHAIRQMLARDLNCPRTSSVGRLFDAIGALLGLRQETRYEGETAMQLEFALPRNTMDAGAYPVELISPENSNAPIIVDWSGLLQGVLVDLASNLARSLISARFHHTLVGAVAAVAGQAGVGTVVLSGGCFQNKYLTEQIIAALQARGVRAFWQELVPPNDGGLALGQIMGANQAWRKQSRIDTNHTPCV